MKNRLMFVSLMLVGLLAPSWSLWAHGGLTPAHGGRMAETTGYRLELVVLVDRVDVYLTNHEDKAVVVEKTKGKVTLLLLEGKVEIPLSGVDGNHLSGGKTVAGGSDAAAVVVIEGLEKTITARWSKGASVK